ncbi:hypothetical protein ACFP81_02720 [Deinococcus lacus]|uniref:Uncharacterized protein n=1 Tax=Deinococcus lacus TaxID=392561 RepID=A0ABW1YA27_9DEIO
MHGEAVATLEATLPQPGAFTAAAHPPTLTLPRSLAGWAHLPYALTLRGKDALSPITSVHHEFRSQFGDRGGLALLQALAQGQSPADYALRAELALTELEPLLRQLRDQGYIREGS